MAVGTPVAVLVEEEDAVAAFKDFAAGGGAKAAAVTAPAAGAPKPAAAGAAQEVASAAGGKDDAYYSALPPHVVCPCEAGWRASQAEAKTEALPQGTSRFWGELCGISLLGVGGCAAILSKEPSALQVGLVSPPAG